MKRKTIPELLDTDSGSFEEVASSLRDLRHINSWFGGNATTASMLSHLAQATGKKSFSLLEVAAGSGDVSQIAKHELGKSGITLNITLLDRVRTHLENGHSTGRESNDTIVADALSLPFADSSFDVIHSCLFAHHLAPEQLPYFANESLRVCRTAVLINDLVRHPLHLALVYAGLPLFRSRITWHDAPASVRQAYTAREMNNILIQSDASKIEIQSHYLFRMGVVLWK
ncbi:MAG TPA: methyltransferase domain-containing protein [Terriglobales bacterium]|nr:methyltransferase domain-containing protein [Terriglobales bacterium]